MAWQMVKWLIRSWFRAAAKSPKFQGGILLLQMLFQTLSFALKMASVVKATRRCGNIGAESGRGCRRFFFHCEVVIIC